MGTLWIINRARALADCRLQVGPTDAVMLIEDAVFAAAATDLVLPACPVFALTADVTARGLAARIPESIAMIDDEAFVALSVTHHPAVCWRAPD